jgi:hypothetical protein
LAIIAGQTPSRKNYAYPTKLVCTKPHSILLEEFRESSKVMNRIFLKNLTSINFISTLQTIDQDDQNSKRPVSTEILQPSDLVDNKENPSHDDKLARPKSCLQQPSKKFLGVKNY